VVVHYTFEDQLRDPIGLLLRDPKYVSRKFQVAFIFVFLLVVTIDDRSDAQGIGRNRIVP
jgi:hypothetical protein